jgi:hypothetical protein
MTDNTENKCENNNADFGNVIRNLFEQVRTQTEAQRRRVHFREEKRNNSEEEKKDSDSETDSEDNDDEYPKWNILLDLADSQKILCRAFAELLNTSNDE